MKASSESGECASLISRVSVDVFEVADWPAMGSVLCATARAILAATSRREDPGRRRKKRHRRKNVRYMRPGGFRNASLAYRAAADKRSAKDAKTHTNIHEKSS